jgi:hypothetical protein
MPSICYPWGDFHLFLCTIYYPQINLRSIFNKILNLRINIYFQADFTKALSRGWLHKAFFTLESRMDSGRE